MAGTIKKRVAKLEARRAGAQIPIYCEEESEVPATIDRMIAAGELADADRVLGVYWLNCKGLNAPSDADLRALLAQCEAEPQRVGAAEAGCVSTSPRPQHELGKSTTAPSCPRSSSEVGFTDLKR
jgi:hypothetical protein